MQYLPSFSEGESTGPSTPTSTLTIPEATLYGSQGLSLQPAYYSPMPTRAHKSSTMVRVRLDILQFGLGVRGTPCSLERLGIVPSRSLTKGKFGSSHSILHSSKSPYTPPLEISQPVLIRGVVPGSPAAVTQQVYSGKQVHYINNEFTQLIISYTVYADFKVFAKLTICVYDCYEYTLTLCTALHYHC